MTRAKSRPYKSFTREQQARETRKRIVEAAKKLFVENGYDATTIEEVAASAQVAVPTIYSVYGAKKEIAKEIINQVRFGPFLEEFTRTAKSELLPIERIRLIANFVRNVNEANSSVDQVMRLSRISDPDVMAAEKERASLRYKSQKMGLQSLMDQNALKQTLDFQTARDILWGLTSPEVFQLLVTQRKWSADKFEQWLSSTLASQLLEK
jgi:AcrR family transcriptional regulator